MLNRRQRDVKVDISSYVDSTLLSSDYSTCKSIFLGVGIWFFSKEPNNTGANSLFLDETTDQWKKENIWTERPARNRACAVAIDDKNIAYIGGQHPGKNFGPNGTGNLPSDEKRRAFGQRISVYNIDTKTETPNFKGLTMKYTRRHLSCTLIPNCKGNPSVAICK